MKTPNELHLDNNFITAFNAITTHGIIVICGKTLDIKFINKWIMKKLKSKDGESTHLPDIPNLNKDILLQELESKGIYTIESEINFHKRPTPLHLTFTQFCTEPDNLILLELMDMTNEKKITYTLDSYAHQLEERNTTLRRERDRSDKLLLNIMPKAIYEEWKKYGIAMPIKRDASVLILDFVDFSGISLKRDPAEIIADMNDIFSSFDKISDHFNCECIKTLGDCYVAVCGLPEKHQDHEQQIANAAISFLRYIHKRNTDSTHKWNVRIGLTSGEIIGSIVGIKKFAFDVFGSAVNLAARLEAISGENQITIDAKFAQKLDNNFICGPVRRVKLKGTGDYKVCTLLENEPDSAETVQIDDTHKTYRP